ncbi:MAG: hypothetical protein RMJ47_06950 [Bacteroidota bacterium]|nr:hypothetical protein [Bacteroidota bacterium]
MQVLVVDLHEDRAALGEEFACQEQPIAQVGEVGMDAEPPGVAVGFDLLRLVGEVFVPVFTSRRSMRGWKLEAYLMP